jgi:hypothetical protein
MHRLSMLFAALSLSFLLTAGCKEKPKDPEGPMESAGEEVDEAGEKAGDNIEKAGDKVEDAADDAN